MRELVREENVSRRMKTIRISKGLTLEDVGKMMGKSLSSVAHQERHPLGVSARTLFKYADVYGCEVSDFFMPL